MNDNDEKPKPTQQSFPGIGGGAMEAESPRAKARRQASEAEKVKSTSDYPATPDISPGAEASSSSSA